MNNKNLNQNNFKKIKIEENLQEIFFFNKYINLIYFNFNKYK